MKYAGTVCGIVVFVLCFAFMAYAEPTAPAPEDKTEAAKATAVAEAKAQIKPLADKVKTRFDKVLEDRKLEPEEMKLLKNAAENYENRLADVNRHLAIYKVSLTSEAYPPAIQLTGLYFTPFFLGDGRWHQDEMRLLAAKEGVDVQKIETDRAPFWVFILALAGIFIVIGMLTTNNFCYFVGFIILFLALIGLSNL